MPGLSSSPPPLPPPDTSCFLWLRQKEAGHMPCSLERMSLYVVTAIAISIQDHPRRRFRVTARLSRAASWAALLENLAAECGDHRTSLEAAAYSGSMEGACALDREDWHKAERALTKAKTIYKQLASVGPEDGKRMCLQSLEEIETSLRYCQYKLTSSDMSFSVAGAPVSEVLKAKLDAVVAETRRVSASSFDTVVLWGTEIAVRNERTRASLVAAQEVLIDLDSSEGTDESRLQLFSLLFSHYAACQQQVREDFELLQGKHGSGKTTSVLTELGNLETWLWCAVQRAQIQRFSLMYNALVVCFQAGKAAQFITGQEGVATASDVVSLLDLLIAATDALVSRLAESKVEDSNILVATGLRHKAARCLYLAIAYSDASMAMQAIKGGMAHADQARQQLTVCFDKAKEETELAQVVTALRRQSLLVRTSFLLSKEPKEEVESKRLLSVLHSHLRRERTHTDAFSAMSFLPAYQVLPAKPLFFDLALNELDPRQVKLPEKKKGWLGFW